MYKKSKRFLAGFLALLLTVTMLPTDMLSVVYAEEDNEAIIADVSEDNDVEEAEALENAAPEDDADEALEENNNLKGGDDTTDPSDSVSDPSDPVTDPSDPVTDPSDPVTDPSDPVTDPSDPVTDPSEPVEADLAPPTANPASGAAITSGTTITLTNPSANAADSKIYYSVVKASEVTATPAADAITQEYTAPVAITEASTVYAVVKGATKASAVAAFAYTIRQQGQPTTKDIVYTLNGDEVAAALGGEKYNAETGLMTEGVTIAGQKVNDYFTIGGKGSVNQISLYEAGTLAEQTTNVYIWDTSITENKTKNTVLIEGGAIAADNNWISFTTKTPNAKLVFYSAYKRSQTSDKELVVRKDSATSSTATWSTAATVARKTIITKYPTDKDYITLPTAGTYYIGYTGGGGIVPFIQVTETVEVSDTPDAPMADPADGSVLDEDDKVSLSVLDDEATIYYTTGATEDTTEDPKTAPDKKTYNPETKITIDVNNKVIKAYAEKSTGASEVITFTYKLRVAAPEAEPENHVLAANGGTITLKCATTDADTDADADKVKIYYTTDGSTPSAIPSALYTAPFSISETSVIKAIAVKTGWENSNLSEFTYIVPTTGETEYIANASIDNGIAAYFKLIGKPGAETVELKKPTSGDYADASSAAFWTDCKEVIADANGNTKVINLTGGSLSSVDNDVTNAVRFVTSAPKTKVVVYHSQKGTDVGGQIQLSSVTDDGKVKADVASDASDHSKIVKSEFTITEPGIYAIGFRGSNKGGGIIPYISVTENPDGSGTTSYTVKFHDGTTELTELEATVTDGSLDLSTITAPTKEGKVFKGWATTADATAPNATGTITVAADTDLYAVWADAIKITLKYANDTAVANGELTAEIGKAIELPSLPNGDGTIFKGWATTKTATEAEYTTSYTPETGATDITLYAVFKEGKAYTVTFDYDYKENASDTDTKKTIINKEYTNDGDKVTIAADEFPTPVRAGYTFVKWTVNGADVTIPEAGYEISANTTFKAVWEENAQDSFTVTFKNGNETVDTKTVTTGLLDLSEVTVPEESGKVFKGWRDEAGTVHKPNVTLKVAKDMILTAVWEDEEVESKVAKPVAKPGNGTEFGPEGGKVELSCETEGATIYYTTNGDTPTAASTKYTAAIDVKTATTIKAIAIVTEGENAGQSAVLEARYTILAADGIAKPTATPEPTDKYVESGTKVTLACATEGAEIYYIKDDDGISEPWEIDDSDYEGIMEEGRKYESPIEILCTTQILAVAVKTTGEGDKATKKYSRVASYFYKVDLGEEYEKSYTTVYLEKDKAEHCTITVPDIVEGKTTQSMTYVTYYDTEKKAAVKFAEGIDYTATWNGKGANDQYTVTLTGLGRNEYDGRSVDGYTIPKTSTITVTYNVIAKTAAKDKSKYVDMSKEKISIRKEAVKNLYYTGYAHELQITDFDFSKASAEVKAAAAKENGLHIAYRNNINAGKATVIISMGSASEEKKDDNASEGKKDDNASKNNSTTKSADEGIETYADGGSEPTSEPTSEVNPPASSSKTFYGAKTLTFNIKKAALNKNKAKETATANILVSDMSYMEWKDSDVADYPEDYVIVTSKPNGKKGLQLDGANYTVTCKTNLKKGQVTITVKGVGNNLSGNISKTVKIGAFDLSNYQIDAEYYNGTEGKPVTENRYDCVYSPKGAKLSSIEIVSKDGKESLTLYEGKDYTAKYKYADKTKAAGTKVDVTKIKGVNGCKGTLADISGVEIKKADFGSSAYLTGKKGLYDGYYWNIRFFVNTDSRNDVKTDLEKTVIVKDYTGAALKLNKDYQIEEVKPEAGSADQTVKYVVKSLDTTNYNQKTNENPDVQDTIEIRYVKATNLAKDKNFMFDKTLDKNDPLGYDGRNPVEITQDALDKYINKLDMTKTIEYKDQKYCFTRRDKDAGELKGNIKIVPGTYKNNAKKGTAQVTIEGTGWSDENHPAFYGTKVLKFKVVDK